MIDFPSALCVQCCTLSFPLALFVSHQQHLTTTSFSLSQIAEHILMQPVVFMESQPEVMKMALSARIAFCPHYLQGERGCLQIRFSIRYSQWQRGS